MSSALDEDTQRTLAEGREAAGDVLRSAQKDMQKVFIVFLVGFLGTFYSLRRGIWDFLKRVTEAKMQAATSQETEIIAQTPFDVILLQAKIGLVAGIIFALPVFLYFARDGLKERDMWPQTPVPVWKLALILLLSAVLFGFGVMYGYLVFFPFMFEFLAGNALAAGFKPNWSIVLWAEFIFLLTLSFGLAAQMPLAMTGLAYAEIVPYETFRDKWRYAVLGIFVFGAMFSPPDPFTQVMWATPLLLLYGFSLYLTKVVVTARRGSQRLDLRAIAGENWNHLAGTFAAGLAAVYLFYERGGRTAVNDALTTVGSRYRILPASEAFGLSATATVVLLGLVVGIALAAVALMYLSYRSIEAAVESDPTVGDPTEIDLADLDREGVRAAPPEAFAALSEEEALAHAQAAIDDDEKAKARAILDRYDAVQERLEEGDLAGGDDAGEGEPDEGPEPGSVTDRTQRAGGTFVEELTEGESDEEDIGGYYTDIKFILDSLTSRAFRIVAVFMVVLAGTFVWLYRGGIGDVYEGFLSRVPGEVTPDTAQVIALHPVEALIFEVKFSALVGLIVTLPVIAYYAWPAMRERGFVRGRQEVIFGWTAALTVGLVGGFLLGFFYIAPTIISYLVFDALRANMIISYRITHFFWLIFFTTAGIGLLVDVPVLMVLLNTAGVSYQSMRNRWREVTLGMLTFAALFTPADILTMFLVTVPLMAAYGVGIAVLFVLTLGGRRNLREPRELVS